MPPLDAERVVLTKTGAAIAAVGPEIFNVEPALKPYHPIHKMKVPSACRTVECFAMGSGGGSLSLPHQGSRGFSLRSMKRSGRGPIITAPTSPCDWAKGSMIGDWAHVA